MSAPIDPADVAAVLATVPGPIEPQGVEAASEAVLRHLLNHASAHGRSAAVGLAGALIGGAAQLLHEIGGHAMVLSMFRPMADEAEASLKALLDIAALPAASEVRQ